MIIRNGLKTLLKHTCLSIDRNIELLWSKIMNKLHKTTEEVQFKLQCTIQVTYLSQQCYVVVV